MHLSKSESVFGIALVGLLTLVLVQVSAYTESFNVQTAKHQASAIQSDSLIADMLASRVTILGSQADSGIDDLSKVTVGGAPVVNIDAASYLVADVVSGKIYAQRDIGVIRPIASITKLLTAIPAEAVINSDVEVLIAAGSPITSSDYRQLHYGVKLRAADTIYPLLMESNNAVAHSLAKYHGSSTFITDMMLQAKAIGMNDTSLADASGISARNVSTARDLFKLARYMHNDSQSILNATRLNSVDIRGGRHTYTITNHNHFSKYTSFIGGKTGYTPEAKQTMLAIFKVDIDNEERTIAVIILGSDKRKTDVLSLYNWFTNNAQIDEPDNRVQAQDGVTHITGPSVPTTLHL